MKLCSRTFASEFLCNDKAVCPFRDLVMSSAYEPVNKRGFPIKGSCDNQVQVGDGTWQMRG
jgi:hypothetical protein